MNKITPEIIRADDRLLAKLSFQLDNDKKSQFVSLEFWSDGQPMDLINTTAGNIKGYSVVIKNPKRFVEICIPYARTIECRIAYLNADNLVQSETITIELEEVAAIILDDTQTDSLQVDGSSFEEKMRQLPQTLAKRPSAWTLKLSLTDAIHVKVLKAGKQPTWACFGQMGHELSNTDFMFTLYPGIESFSIPTELILKYHRHHLRDGRLSVFELVRADFHRIPDVLYKSVISNSIRLSEFTMPERHLVSYFTAPTGEPLGDRWVVSNNLPQLQDDT